MSSSRRKPPWRSLRPCRSKDWGRPQIIDRRSTQPQPEKNVPGLKAAQPAKSLLRMHLGGPGLSPEPMIPRPPWRDQPSHSSGKRGWVKSRQHEAKNGMVEHYGALLQSSLSNPRDAHSCLHTRRYSSRTCVIRLQYLTRSSRRRCRSVEDLVTP